MRRRIVACFVAAWLIGPAATAWAANDTYFSEQWGLHRVRAEEAWGPSGAGAGVTIAVIDTGVDAAHQDLGGKVVDAQDFSGTGGTGDVHGHGTMVAGIAAAQANNGLGVAGTAPDARIMSLRLIGPEGEGSTSGLSDAIVYAADHGAKVINLSLEKIFLDLTEESAHLEPAGFPGYALVPGLDDALWYAWARGVLIVAAAGNGALPWCSAPAFSPFVLCVGATTRADDSADFSNFGARIDVVAPGVDILSTYFKPSEPGVHAYYASGPGTSFAAPFVSGVGALLMGMGADNVEAALLIRCTATDLGLPGYDPVFGHGLVNARAAVDAYRDGCPVL